MSFVKPTPAATGVFCMKLTRSVNGKLLRCGYTTGSCAAAAAKAAATMLLSGKEMHTVTLETPKGLKLSLAILDVQMNPDSTSCAIQKDAGDDPDVTDGILVYARVNRMAEGIEITGCEGVGRITKPGLDQPVGESAINSTPRRMIVDSVSGVCKKYGYMGGIRVCIYIPGGEKLAKRTFNPRIGIEGGLSVIGTTGIVEPMSNAALIDTIRLEIRQLAATNTKSILLTPGNYGEAFARKTLGLSMKSHISCSNFIGDAVDAAVENGFSHILLVGHIGKLVKLGIGITNTHSANGDGRMETLLACALASGAGLPMLRKIADSITTDGALAILSGAGLLEETMAILGGRIDDCLKRRVPGGVTIAYVCFANTEKTGGVLAQSDGAEELMRIWRKNP